MNFFTSGFFRKINVNTGEIVDTCELYFPDAVTHYCGKIDAMVVPIPDGDGIGFALMFYEDIGNEITSFDPVYGPPVFDAEKPMLYSVCLRKPYSAEQYELVKVEKLIEVRAKRDKLLLSSDEESRIIYSDFWESQTDQYKNAWLAYRQTLRDLPASAEDPFDIVWPSKPV